VCDLLLERAEPALGLTALELGQTPVELGLTHGELQLPLCEGINCDRHAGVPLWKQHAAVSPSSIDSEGAPVDPPCEGSAGALMHRRWARRRARAALR